MTKNNTIISLMLFLVLISNLSSQSVRTSGWTKIGGPFLGGEITYLEKVNGNNLFTVIGHNQLFHLDSNTQIWNKIFQHPFQVTSLRYIDNKYYAIGNQVCKYRLYESEDLSGWRLIDEKLYPAKDIIKYEDHYLLANWGNGVFVLDGNLNLVDTNKVGLRSYNTNKFLVFGNRIFVIGNGAVGVDGKEGCGVHYSDDGGYTWHSIDNFNNDFVRDIEIDKNGRIFVGSGGGLFCSTDNGEIWELCFETTAGYPIMDIEFDAEENIYFVKHGAYGVYEFNNQLTSYSEIKDRGIAVEILNGECIIGDQSLGLYRCDNTNNIWEEFNNGLGSRARIDNVLVDKMHRIYALILYDGIYYSDDELTWHKINRSELTNTRAMILNQEDNLIAVSNGNTYLINRSDLVANKVSNKFSAYKYNLVMNKVTGKIYGGNYNLYSSNDNGNNWEEVDGFASINTGGVNSIAVNDNDNIIIAAEQKFLRRTTRGGWEDITTNIPSSIILPTDDNHIFYACDKFYLTNNKELFYTTDLGNTWIPTDLRNRFQNVQYFYEIYEGGNDEVYITSNLPHYLFHTTTNGDSWTSFEGDLVLIEVGVVQSLAIRNDGALYAGTIGNGLIKYSGYISSVSESDKINKGYYLSQNYPNPFNPTTSIEYQVKSIGIVNLVIYNMLGQQVTTLVNEVKSPGVYEVQFDGSNLSSGMYFYQLTSGEFTQTRKLMLLK